MAATLNKNNIIKVSQEVLKRIEALGEEHCYSAEAELYYEGHIPVVAYLFIEGKGRLFKKRRKDQPLGPGDRIGLIELATHTPSEYGAKVNENTKVIFLDRSTINEIIEDAADDDLKTIFEKLLIHA